MAALPHIDAIGIGHDAARISARGASLVFSTRIDYGARLGRITMKKTNQRAATSVRAVLGGMALGVCISGCEQKPPVCQPPQYWSTVLRACVGIGEYMDAHGGSFPDGFAPSDASMPEAAMDATPEASTLVCDGGQRACGSMCVDPQSDPLNCGACGAACPGAANAAATCVAGRCDLRCDMGAHRCGNSCLRDTDTASCGARCTPCPEPVGGTPTCSAGTCGYTCNAGYDDTGSACEMRTARPIFPWGLSTVTMLRPTLSWELAMGLDGAQVELCRDRACTMLIERVNATGTSTRPTVDLPASTVVFWRLRGRVGAATGARTSATWQFRTPARSATMADTAHGTELDVNGDGFSDVAIAAPGAGRVDVYYGSATGLSAMPGAVVMPTGGVGSQVASVGDVNGDGYGDLAVTEASGAFFSVFAGSAMGLNTTALSRVAMISGGRATGLGDVNADGYSDVATGAPSANTDGLSENGMAFVFHGTRAGLGMTAAWSSRGSANGANLGEAIAGAVDINGDRVADMIVGASGSATPAGAAAGSVMVYRGAAGGFATTPEQTLEGTQPGAHFGATASSLGSVDADGFGDVVIGSPYSTESGQPSGRATIVAGGSGGVMWPSMSIVLRRDTTTRQFASIVRGIGDVNGDGFNDVAIGSAASSPGGRTSAGAIEIHLGSSSGVVPTASVVFEGEQPSDQFGSSISTTGDCNADGFNDIVIGSALASPSGRMFAGRASLWLGRATVFNATSDRTIDGTSPNGGLGTSVAVRALHRRLKSAARCAH